MLASNGLNPSKLHKWFYVGKFIWSFISIFNCFLFKSSGLTLLTNIRWLWFISFIPWNWPHYHNQALTVFQPAHAVNQEKNIRMLTKQAINLRWWHPRDTLSHHWLYVWRIEIKIIFLDIRLPMINRIWLWITYPYDGNFYTDGMVSSY